MDNTSPSDPDSHKSETDSGDDLTSCLHVLRRSRAIRWGIRKRVIYESRKVKEVKSKMSMRGESDSESKVGGSSKQGMAEREIEETVPEVKKLSGGKRMREGSSGANERKLKKISSSRWSVERCESAKKALLEVVREMDATWHKPVLRHDLREKARKHIGDTGLLDHLLKHMAGEVFADGKERLVRRYNTEGAIEYWLEPAELAMLRQEAGITDPYLIPPPGWKLGDASSGRVCDGPCKEMISQCKEEINHLKSEVAMLKSLKETEKAQQEKYLGLLMQHGKLQEQVTAISNSMVSMKEEFCLLKEENEKRRKEELAMAVKETSVAGCSGEKHSVQEKEKGKQVEEGDGVGTKEKTARKSGSRICRPEDTSVWPNMTSAGGYSPRSTPSAMSLPPQLILLPSPTFPLPPPPRPPPPCPAFFFQQQPDSQRWVRSISQVQSQAAVAQSPSQGTAHRPTTRHPSDVMMNSGASSRVDCEAFALSMAPEMISEKRNDVVTTDLALASFKY